PGTPAATMENQIPKAVVQERYEALAELQDRISAEENAAIVGREVNVLVASGEGRKDAERHRSSGRAEDGRLVHFDVPADGPAPSPRQPRTLSLRMRRRASCAAAADARATRGIGQRPDRARSRPPVPPRASRAP